MTDRPILFAGRNGQLAMCLRDLATTRGLPAVALGRPELDLENREGIDKLIASIGPSAIINTAAYTAVDQAEAEAARAFSINRDGAAALADVAWQMNIPLIHLSTDYVFDGAKPEAYDESDIPAPLNVYGASKLAGEAAVLAAHPLATVIRCSWLYSPYGSNFVRTMLRLCETQQVVRVVSDQHGNPTYAFDLAEAVLRIAQQSLTDDRRATAGIFHLGGQGEASWYDFAQAIFHECSHRGARIRALEAITTEEFPTAARRPLNSRLDSSKAERVFGIRLAPWRHSLQACLDQLVGEGETDAEGNRAGWRQRNAPLSDHTSGQQAVASDL
ncbi:MULTISPECIES: dTDP-4-dehydrorhamnose reductase [Bradyrhizobium]|uniref:dTDP-4-dehydrorhamnose reductase n=1 Tax=Bradyrhizobium TaxID=374 RepID=UPI001CD50B37|nr:MULTISPECIES: dTDP-4-dehydrorhamnose reductase [unclassified Bradyrhizobium]MCA1428213.1 dTDP-4-dehydrorhamnose reductase [Bradyrhizobium sp. NBAIM16]MCA1497347.1 dTDP-4-dehydrorhamnose reductase [Bradyrhizobium sp. NBAIM14]MCA1504645.1 dTDP-4-dehydrorhamnose reductase [Bradyrhizobium sp. NBAIM02]MCA1533645.1 dTDP-4-dehydrorhamnose reductase [Bradyrhizobium sp. NBAIM03]UWU81943.1 dTDP-4-dehydrorhamnose reductase [Bradyrhizobium sp. CB1024]